MVKLIAINLNNDHYVFYFAHCTVFQIQCLVLLPVSLDCGLSPLINRAYNKFKLGFVFISQLFIY